MPFKEHLDFKPPEDKDVKIWRYTDMSKFLSLVVTGKLYFPSLKIISKDDPYEGLYTKPHLDMIGMNFSEKSKEEWEEIGIESEERLSIVQKFFSKMIPASKDLRDSFFVNCWHINNYESMAM